MRVLTALALFAVAGFAVADDAKKKEPTGAYTRKADTLSLKLEFKKDHVVVFHVDTGNGGCVMTSKCTVDKDGTHNCEVTDFEKKGDFDVDLPKGFKFSFKIEVKDKAVVLSDLKGDNIQDEQKKAVEGEYEKAAGD
jgi:hypothetical protein